MELVKHKNHRNPDYLSWLRRQRCVVSGKKAECAHHIRLGTNGGSSLKPSDYFCIPLLNEYHTSGLFALHVVGEDTFLKHFKLDKHALFIDYLKKYLEEKFDVYVQLEDQNPESLIAYLIKLVEEKGPSFPKAKKKKKAKADPKPKVSTTENDYYQKAKELKRVEDKKLRDKIKAEKKKVATPSLKGNEFYEKAKELKRAKDKELRQQLKQNKTKSTKSSFAGNEYYEKAKEAKRARDKALRDQMKQAKKAQKLAEKQL